VTDADLDAPCYLDPENQVLLTRESMIWFWDHYAPDPADREHPDASPARASDLTGLAPAIVITAEHDPLRDEGEAYAERLALAGVPVTQRRFAGQMHAFFTMVGVLPGSADAIDYLTEQLGQRLDTEEQAQPAG
jgi:acetyl esterase